jgi:hypothetical protein
VTASKRGFRRSTHPLRHCDSRLVGQVDHPGAMEGEPTTVTEGPRVRNDDQHIALPS